MKSTRFYGKSKTPATLSRLLDLAEENAWRYRNEDGQFSVTILPPTNATGYITNEDSGDEDGTGTVNNLPGSMLLAPAILDESSNPNDETVEEPPKKKRRKQTDSPSRSWAKTDLKSDLLEWVPDDTIIEELWAKKLTPKRLFWENATDTHQALVANAMRRDKFKAIFANFHLADNHCLDDTSSVARGGARAPPIGLWSMQNRTFLVLLRPTFGEKLKIAPHRKTASPPTFEFRKISLKFGEDLFFGDHLILGEKNVWISDFGRKISLNFGEDLSFCFIFGDHLILGGKNVWNSELSEKCRLDFQRNRVTLIQEQWKFGSRSYALFSLFQNSPPPLFQTLATRLDDTDKFAKVRPLIKLLNKKFQQYAPNDEFCSFDESMCVYYGRHGCK